MRRTLIFAATICLAMPAVAEEPTAGDAAAGARLEEAKLFLKSYLDSLAKAPQGQGRKPKPAAVSKKLLASKKFLHPKTIERIAEQEKRGIVTNAVATWHWAKADYWLLEYEIGEAKEAQLGTVVIEAQEKNWRVEEAGVDGEPAPTSYLLYKLDGKWVLVDKRRNSSFTRDAIKIGYKGYFAEPKADVPAAGAQATKEAAEE